MYIDYIKNDYSDKPESERSSYISLTWLTKPTLSSMEESAIKQGFDDLRDGHDYDPLYHSALCRAKADWLIGINATRLFSVLYNHTLNVGRVQTPTLSLLVERDNAIQNFEKKKYNDL